jgi:hypothetical protein
MRINVPLDSHVKFGVGLQIIKHTYAICMKHFKPTIRNMATMRFVENITEKYTVGYTQSVFNFAPNKEFRFKVEEFL